MSDFGVSKHGYCRMKERVGGGKLAANRITKRAYEKGLCPENTAGQLGRYMLSRENAYSEKGVKVRIYGDMIYLFSVEDVRIRLITVYRLPNNLIRQACAAQKKA